MSSPTRSCSDLAHAEGQALVGRLLGHRVLELVLRIGRVAAPRGQVELVQSLQVPRDLLRATRARVGVRDPAGAEAAPDHARHLDRRLLALAELVEPGRQQPLEPVGQLQRRQRPGVAEVHARRVEVGDELLEVERVALALLGDPGEHPGVDVGRGRVAPAHVQTDEQLGLGPGQVPQVQLARVGEPAWPATCSAAVARAVTRISTRRSPMLRARNSSRAAEGGSIQW